jgi:hypothetical protein
MEDLSQRNMGTHPVEDCQPRQKIEEKKEKEQEDSGDVDLQQEITGKLRSLAITKLIPSICKLMNFYSPYQDNG